MDITIASAQELAIIAAVVAAGTQLIKQTKLPHQYLPYVAAVIGVIAGLVAVVIAKDTNYAAGAVQGLITAASTSWVVDAAKPITGKVTETLADKQASKAAEQQKAIDAAVKVAIASQQTVTATQAATEAPAGTQPATVAEKGETNAQA